MPQILIPGSDLVDASTESLETLIPGGALASLDLVPPLSASILSVAPTGGAGVPTVSLFDRVFEILSVAPTGGAGLPTVRSPPPFEPCVDPEDYVDLIPAANRSAPDFVSTVRLVTDPAIDLRELLCDFGRWFDVDTAIGAQLDVVGDWVGVSRYVSDGVVPFFSLGDELLGFGRGVWKTTINPPSGLLALDDDSYRALIRSKIAANSWDGTMESLPGVLSFVFPPTVDSHLVVLDNQDMTMTIAISGEYPGSLVIALLRQGLFPVKPAGVGVLVRITTAFGSPVFGFGVDNEYIGGFGSGAWAEEL